SRSRWCSYSRPAQDDDGDTTASKSRKTSPSRRASRSASAAYPLFRCIWPQHVCSAGNATSCPRRSRRLTVAWPASGNSVSPRHVTKSATRIEASCSLVRALEGGRSPLAGEPLCIAAAPERLDRVRIDSEACPKSREERSDVRLEGLDEDPVRAEHVAFVLRFREPRAIDEERLGIGRLNVPDRLDHRVDLPLDIVRLVDHQREVGGFDAGDLVRDPEELERVDGADDEVVVRVLAVVEVEPAEQALREEHGDD